MTLDRDQTTWKKAFVRHGYVGLVETEGQEDLERKESRLDRIERLGKVFYAGIAPSMEDPAKDLQGEELSELEEVPFVESGSVIASEPSSFEDNITSISTPGSSAFIHTNVRQFSLPNRMILTLSCIPA